VLAAVSAVSHFAVDLSELCASEGQWLAILALAPRVLQKFSSHFAQLAGAIDAVLQLLYRKDANAEDPLVGDCSVALQPSATSNCRPALPAETAVADGKFSGGHLFREPGRAASLHALLSSAYRDLSADLQDEAFNAIEMSLEIEVAMELQKRLLLRGRFSQAGKSELKSTPEQEEPESTQAAQVDGEEELLDRVTRLPGAQGRPRSALARELEAARQYCRLFDGSAAPSPIHRGTETRSAAGRDALVSEGQASGGSALHRWIRSQFSDTHATNGADASPFPSGSSAVAAAGGAADADFAGGGSHPKFLARADIPHEFLCPIGQDVMRDAVSTADGHTYERRNIEAWLAENSTSPITGLSLANKTLIPNHNLRKLILDSGILSRLEPDVQPDAPAICFKSEVCFEIVVPRDAPTLAEALLVGLERASASSGSSSMSGTHHRFGQSRDSRPYSGSRGPLAGPPLKPFGIRLLAGEHLVSETLLIDHEVEIVGNGASSTTLKLAPDVCFEMRGAGRLASCAVCRDPGHSSTGRPSASEQRQNDAGSGSDAATASRSVPRLACSNRTLALVEVLQGSCRIEHCDLSNASGSAIRISGAHTSPDIAHNVVHGCLDTGVVFKDGADGSLTSNRLFGNCSVAIEVHTRADPLIEDNDVFDGQQGGVFVYNRGKGHLRRNKIFRNALEGVEIKQGGRPLVEDNDIYDNLECGIFIHEGGEGRIISNRIHSNSYAGIEVKDASAPEVRGNDIYSGRTSGMYVHSGGHGVIEQNQIHQNWLHGIYVRNNGSPHLLKNTIFRNDECGIFITESSHPCVEHNEVHSNGLAGIEVKEDSNPTIKLNRIHGGNTGGIFVLARGRGQISENKLYKNKLEGIEIKDGADPQVIDNDICENLECGVFAHDGALGRIEGNRIYGNAYAGVEIKDMSSPTVKGNRVFRGHTSGVYVHTGGRGKVVDNEIFENGLHGVMILSGGQPSLSGNQVHDNAECGVVAHVAYTVDTLANQVYGNRIKNVQLVKS